MDGCDALSREVDAIWVYRELIDGQSTLFCEWGVTKLLFLVIEVVTKRLGRGSLAMRVLCSLLSITLTSLSDLSHAIE